MSIEYTENNTNLKIIFDSTTNKIESCTGFNNNTFYIASDNSIISYDTDIKILTLRNYFILDFESILNVLNIDILNNKVQSYKLFSTNNNFINQHNLFEENQDITFNLRTALNLFSQLPKQKYDLITDLIKNAKQNNDHFYLNYLKHDSGSDSDFFPYNNKIVSSFATLGGILGLYKFVDRDMYEYPDKKNEIFNLYYNSNLTNLSNVDLTKFNIMYYLRLLLQKLMLIPGLILSPIIIGISIYALNNMS